MGPDALGCLSVEILRIRWLGRCPVAWGHGAHQEGPPRVRIYPVYQRSGAEVAPPGPHATSAKARAESRVTCGGFF